MMNLLIFFAIPFAIVIYSIALQKLLRCPFLVAGIIFSTFLIISFATMNINFLIAGIIYTIISFVSAYITMLIDKNRREREENRNNDVSTINNFNNIRRCNCNR